MVKCANCGKEAAYTCADPGVNPVNYCVTCLPQWLRSRADLGHFPLVKPAAKESKSSKKAVVEETTAVEEVPADENN